MMLGAGGPCSRSLPGSPSACPYPASTIFGGSRIGYRNRATMGRPTKAIVDLRAVRKNYRFAQRLAPASRNMAVVKADAYGHGAARVAQCLSAAAPAFAVATIDEAIVLRQSGIETPILLLEGVFTQADIGVCLQNNFWIMAHDDRQLDWICSTPLESRLTVWIKIDTGMRRLGFGPTAFDRAYMALKRTPWVHHEIVVVTHLHSADHRDETVDEQLAFFSRATRNLDAPLSIANSAGLMAHEATRRQWNRPGVMLYGISPFDGSDGVALGLAPAMSLVSEVMAIRAVKRGEGVGYGASWRAARDSVIATVPIGYADGYPRHMGSGAPVIVAGARAMLAGRVSMDMITVDVTDAPDVRPGSPVELWGPSLSVSEVAAAAETIAYEMVTRISARVPRYYIEA